MSKKQRKKGSSESLVLSPQEETELGSLLQDLPGIELSGVIGRIPTARLAQAVLESLPAEGEKTAHLVLALKRAFLEKGVQKAAKKAIFRLKQRGIPVSDSEGERPRGPLVGQVKPASDPMAYLGLVDGVGARAVFLVVPQPASGVGLGTGVVSDEQGLLDFMFGRYSRKRTREIKDLFFARVPHMMETSLAHAATILEAAYGKSKSGLTAAAADYLQLRPWLLEHVSLLSRPPVYDLIPPERLASSAPTEPGMELLFAHEWMRSWIIDPQTIGPLFQEVVKAEESRILISEEQKKARIHDLKESHLPAIFPDEKRVLMKGRLEEMAYLFFKTGKEDHARTALAAALSMDEKDCAFRVNPFLRFMIERSLAFYKKSTEKKGEHPARSQAAGSGLILP